ncbi:BirA family transcriptional regulator, biotin operon repressor / biotin-[acetyl-CoA-carboxylase] ligase [Noviherbaspirillum humi]|uniref:biotin--[biotin carboxyl-carrier protein] ligase n=1 Tax=Noviherbaspirillum humi TaxID=1688639 RepID=A0A239CEQ0_9BURK|nr:biotin--[acetyl-CoA-carboxylase] ligase [Noviherbaspirillum humi]SNS17823.1 BirA family transcriptional regulator, biotin operon repressor / biotin-[acetyl-CoA-carboxylase] ligase [Noviherbaspirillum humi]
MTSLLDSTAVAALLREPASAIDVRVVAQTGSTNADLIAAVGGFTSPVLLAAEHQTAGRGRAGRTWHSAPGGSLAFSLAWRFARPLAALVGLPLAVGVAVAEALAMFELTVQLKWPNDVLYEERKLGGILVESRDVSDAGAPGCWAVIGIGLNLALPRELEAAIDRPVASVPWLAALDRNLLLATLANSLAQVLVQFEQHGFPALQQRWNALHAWRGREVALLDQGKVLQQGVAVGVDGQGCLLIDTPQGRRAVMSGDVSLREVGA